MTLNGNEWKEHITRWCIASGVGACGGLLLSLTGIYDELYNLGKLMVFGGAAALLSIVAIEIINTKNPSILVLVALLAGLSGPSIITNAMNAMDGLKIFPFLKFIFPESEPSNGTVDAEPPPPQIEMPGGSTSQYISKLKSSEDRAEREPMFPSSEKREIPQIFKTGETFDSQELDVTKSRFCLEMMRPECKVPANADEISLLDIRTIEDNVRKIFFWTSMKADQGSQNVVHVWSSSERPDAWYEAIHISIGDKITKFTTEDKIRLKERLLEIKEASPNIHAVQAVVLSLAPSSRFRTYSSLRAVSGRYSVEVWHPDNLQVVSGGEAKTILIKSPSESRRSD